MTLTIRKGASDDTERLVELVTEASGWLAGKGLDQWSRPPSVDRIVRAIDNGELWVVADGARIVATLTVDTRADPEFWQPEDDPANALYAHRMVVARDRAGQRIGSTLLDFAGRRAVAAGRQWLRLDAWATNPGLQDYYRQQGFNHVRTHHLPYRGSGALFQRPAGQQRGDGPPLTE